MKLTKTYKVVAKDGELLFPIDSVKTSSVYPANDTIYFQSDNIEEANAFVKEHNLVLRTINSDNFQTNIY